VTVTRTVRFDGRLTMVTVPREESKRLQISIPPLEIVTFTVAFEEGVVLMTRRDVFRNVKNI